jgi:hypothetical protein
MGVQPLVWVYVYGRIFWAESAARIAQPDLAGSYALDEITRIEGGRMKPSRATSFACSLFVGLSSIHIAIEGNKTIALLCAMGAGLNLFIALVTRNEQEDA